MIVAGSIVKRCLGVKKKEPQYIVVSGINVLIFGFVIEQILVRGYVLNLEGTKDLGDPLIG